ncbi:MAG: hypothetical protein JWN71_1404 [Xanthobacteraceae bacterium]|jgi:uncharacterized membrane protein (UPF0127 family)|nr:hypothetical protein [Xanthobacteraceae bacterium]
MLTTFLTTHTPSRLAANVLRRPGFVRLKAIVLAITLVFTAAWAFHANAAEFEQLNIVGKTGLHRFQVEIARTDQERATGLMHRKELAEGRGMLFDFAREQEVSMWMENTYVSLDMIFIRRNGRILSIAENTTPLSRAIVSSKGPAFAVLEVVAGTAKKLGLAPGDQVAHPLFSQ